MDECMQISARALKAHLSAVLRRVRDGEEVSVTYHGKVVAYLSPPPGNKCSGVERLRGQPWVRAGKVGVVRDAAHPAPVPEGTTDEILRWVRGE
jgi:prevent-host-death family protein